MSVESCMGPRRLLPIILDHRFQLVVDTRTTTVKLPIECSLSVRSASRPQIVYLFRQYMIVRVRWCGLNVAW
jgi:hypothetical protein